MKEITSLHQAIDLVATKVAHIVVSSANTGAYMALSGKIIPSLNEQSPISQTLLLDLGANVSCSAETLASFAILARNYLFKAHHLKTPKIGILNIGSEAGKGTEELQEAFNIISNLSDIDFIGFVEGDNLLNGIAHIIICDGFHGNIALKTLEGTIQTFYSLLKTTMRRPSSFRSKIGALLLKNEFKRTFEEIYNPKRYNGALFMGLNGNVIKSHGGADSESFAYAIRTAYEIAQSNYH
jgi:glycerol-3-phosphate acyltransferase PlsX